MTPPGTDELIALGIALSFAAGFNLSAVLVTLGLLARGGVLTLPEPIGMLDDWWVIGISGALFVIEFFADKIPAFDLVWNALLTFIRVPAGALLAYAATGALSPSMQLLAAAGGGAIAAAAHGTKLALRGTASASPEPFSNWALSLGEDAFAIGLTWFAANHPFIAAAIALVLVVVAIAVMRVIVRAFRRVFRGAARQIDGGGPAPPGTA